jgi:hypothetical protein
MLYLYVEFRCSKSNCWSYVIVWKYIITIILQNKWHYVAIKGLLSLLCVWRLMPLQVACLINRVSTVQNCYINQNKRELRFSWQWMLRLLLSVFWAVTLCSLVDGCLHFGGYQEDVGSKSLQNVGICLPKSVMSQPRRM